MVCLLVSQGVPVSNFRIMDHLVVLSDHWPIQVSLAVDFAAVSESAGQRSRRIDWHACSVRDIDAYRADLDDRLRMIAVPTYAICCPSPMERCDHGDGLLASCDIETAMKEASKRHVPRRPHPGCRKPGWSPTVSNAQKEASIAYQNWKGVGTPRFGESFERMRATQRAFRQSRRCARRSCEKRAGDHLLNCLEGAEESDFWSRVRKCRGRNSACTQAKFGNAESADEICEFWRSHFQILVICMLRPWVG